MKQRLVALIFVLGMLLPLSSLHAGTILSAFKFAWGSNIGYVNFEETIVDDFVLSGYAWSTNAGWIKLNPAEGGVLNDGSGNLSGSAWGEQLGWIDFENVTINSSTGRFSGTATGDLSGIITFDCGNCDVRTDWSSVTPPPPPTGGGGGTPIPPELPTIELLTIGSEPVPVPSSPTDVTYAEIRSNTPTGDAPYRADPFPDGRIDVLDFNVLMVHWGELTGDANSPSCRDKIFADINCDGHVDIIDFNELMVYWGMHVNAIQ